MIATAYNFEVPTNLLTAKQVAVKLGVSKRRVLALITAGRLPAEKVGMQYLVQPMDLRKVRVRRAGRPRRKSQR